MNKFIVMAAACGLIFVSTAPAKAQEVQDSFLTFGVGAWDATQNDDTAVDFRIEYRHGESLFWKIKPWAGIEGTSDGSVWGGIGILADLKLTDNIYIAPNFGAGLYAQGGNDKDLDYPLEFRSQIEGGYEFDSGERVGLAFGHISNANLGDDNPGTEILNVYFHIPIDPLF